MESNFELCFEHSLVNSLKAMIKKFPEQFELFARPEKYADVILSSISSSLVQDIGDVYQVNMNSVLIGKDNPSEGDLTKILK